MATDKIRNFIVLFLELNPNPADFQVHALAQSLGCDKEALESVFYKMLGESTDAEELEDDTLIEASIEDVLSGDYNPATTPANDLMANDGDINNENIGFQDELNNDGVSPEDDGVGLDQQDVLSEDGVLSIPA